MKNKPYLWLLLGALLILCIAGVKYSELTQTDYVPEDGLILVVTNAGFPDGSRAMKMSNFVSRIAAMSTFPGSNSINATNITRTNTTMFGLFRDKQGQTLRFDGLEQGSNSVLFYNGSNVVINSQPGSGGGSSSISIGGMVYVATNGSDSTGTRGRLDKPYLTPVAAKAASIAGDTIIVYPGLYSDSAVTNLLKDQVNWHFMAGAILSNRLDGVIRYSDAIWNNSSYGVAGAVTSKITGQGTFIQIGGWPDEAYIGGLIAIDNTSSKISIECDEIRFSGVSSVIFAVSVHEASYFHLKCKRLDAAAYLNEIGTASAAGGVWWENGRGIIDIEDGLYSNYVSIYGIGDAAAYWKFTVPQVISTNAAAFWFGPSHAENRVDIDVADMIGSADGASSGGCAVSVDGGKAYISAKKLSKRTGNSDANKSAIIGINGGRLWLTSQKVTTTNDAPFYVQSGGTADIEVQEYEDNGSGAGTRPYNFFISGGTNSFHGGRSVSRWGPGFKTTGGHTHISGMKIDTYQTLQGTNYPIWLANGSVSLESGTTLIPGGSYAVHSDTAQNLRIYGTVSCKSNINANVTVLSGELLVNEFIDR